MQRSRALDRSVEAEGYPYRIVCWRMLHTYNSNGQDLDRARLGAGGLMEISTKTGAILGVVQPDATLRTGLVSMPHSFGGLPGQQDKKVREHGTNTGRLLRGDDGVDRYTGQPRMSNLPVRVKAAETLA